MFGLYLLEDRNGFVHIMSAYSIHKRVIKDSQQSDYNWIASAKELIRICEQKNFPEKYAIDIKNAILNCYTKVINSDEICTYGKNEGLAVAYDIYNSLFGIQKETVIKARTKFLNAFIFKTEYNSLQFLFRRGETFWQICNDWEKRKFNELFCKAQINFIELSEFLKHDFVETIKKAEIEGLFEEDTKRENEIQRKIIEESVNDFIETHGTPSNPKKKTLKIDK